MKNQGWLNVHDELPMEYAALGKLVLF